MPENLIHSPQPNAMRDNSANAHYAVSRQTTNLPKLVNVQFMQDVVQFGPKGISKAYFNLMLTETVCDQIVGLNYVHSSLKLTFK
jgi:hypothetical protein